MKAIILCAGYATRLYPLTLNLPKALLPIKGKPILNYTIDKIKPFVKEAIVISNTRFYQNFHDWSKSYKGFVKVIDDKTNTNENRLGGIGDLWLAIKKEKINEDILVILGDNLFDFELKGFIAEFEKNKKTTVGIYQLDLEEIKKMSAVKIKDGKIIAFEEKPQEPKTNFSSIGLYIFSKKDIAILGEYMKTSLSKEGPGYLVKYLCTRQEVYPYEFKGKWFDIGSKEAYQKVQDEW